VAELGGIFLDILTRLNIPSVNRTLREAQSLMRDGGARSSAAFAEGFTLDPAMAQFKKLVAASDDAYRQMQIGLADLQVAESRINDLRVRGFQAASASMVAAQREVDAAISNTSRLIAASNATQLEAQAARGATVVGGRHAAEDRGRETVVPATRGGMTRGQNILGAGATFGVGAFLGEGLKHDVKIDDLINQIQAQQHISADDRRVMTQSLWDISRQTGFKPEELAKNYGQISRATDYNTGKNYQGQAAVDLMRNSAMLNRISGAGSLEESIQAVSTTSHDYRIPVEKAAALLSRGYAGNKGSAEDYEKSLHSIEPQASAMNIDPVEIFAALDQMSQTGQTSQQSAPNLTNLLKKFASPTKPQGDFLGQIGLNPQGLSADFTQNGLAGTLQLVRDAIAKNLGPDGNLHLQEAYQNQMVQEQQQEEFDKLSPAAQQLVSLPAFEKSEVSPFRARSMFTTPDGQKKLREMGGGDIDTSGITDQDFPRIDEYLRKNKELHGPNSAIRSDKPEIMNASAAAQAAAGTAEGGRTLLMLAGSQPVLDQYKQREKEFGAAATPEALQADFEKSMDDAAKKLLKFTASLESLEAQAGQHLLPMFSKMVGGLNRFMDFLDKVPEAGQALLAAISGVAVAWSGAKLMNIFKDLEGPFSSLMNGARTVGEFLSNRLPTQVGAAGVAAEELAAAEGAAAGEVGTAGGQVAAAGTAGSELAAAEGVAAGEVGTAGGEVAAAGVAGSELAAAEGVAAGEISAAGTEFAATGVAADGLAAAGGAAAGEIGAAGSAFSAAAGAAMGLVGTIGGFVALIGPAESALQSIGLDTPTFHDSIPDQLTKPFRKLGHDLGITDGPDPYARKTPSFQETYPGWGIPRPKQGPPSHARGGIVGYKSGGVPGQPLMGYPDMGGDSLLGFVQNADNPVMLRGGEGILTPEAVSALGGASVVDKINSGKSDNPFDESNHPLTKMYSSFADGVAKYSPWGKYLKAAGTSLEARDKESDDAAKLNLKGEKGEEKGEKAFDKALKQQYDEELGLKKPRGSDGTMASIERAYLESGFPPGQFKDLKFILSHESGFNPNARNPSSGAYGLGQFLGHEHDKYGAMGAYSGNAYLEAQAMLSYISDRYGTPANAAAFWKGHNWYSKGGVVKGYAEGGNVPGDGPGQPSDPTGSRFRPNWWAHAVDEGRQKWWDRTYNSEHHGAPFYNGRTPGDFMHDPWADPWMGDLGQRQGPEEFSRGGVIPGFDGTSGQPPIIPTPPTVNPPNTVGALDAAGRQEITANPGKYPAGVQQYIKQTPPETETPEYKQLYQNPWWKTGGKKPDSTLPATPPVGKPVVVAPPVAGDKPPEQFVAPGTEPGTVPVAGGDRDIADNPSRPGGMNNTSKGFGISGGLMQMAESAITAAAGATPAGPAGSMATQSAFQLLNRAIGFGGQLVGIGLEGLMQTFSLNDSALADPSNSLFGKVALGIAGAHPSPGNSAGKSAMQLSPKDDLDKAAKPNGGGGVTINGDVHNHAQQQMDGFEKALSAANFGGIPINGQG